MQTTNSQAIRMVAEFSASTGACALFMLKDIWSAGT